jgi:transcriptional regulator with XRE-family HTH domain
VGSKILFYRSYLILFSWKSQEVMKKNFLQELRPLRESKGFTQAEIAKILDIYPSVLSSWEKGIHEPNLDYLCQLADLLDVSVDTLLGREPVPPTRETNVPGWLLPYLPGLATLNKSQQKAVKALLKGLISENP